jgi:hypothetical protein
MESRPEVKYQLAANSAMSAAEEKLYPLVSNATLVFAHCSKTYLRR